MSYCCASLHDAIATDHLCAASSWSHSNRQSNPIDTWSATDWITCERQDYCINNLYTHLVWCVKIFNIRIRILYQQMIFYVKSMILQRYFQYCTCFTATDACLSCASSVSSFTYSSNLSLVRLFRLVRHQGPKIWWIRGWPSRVTGSHEDRASLSFGSSRNSGGRINIFNKHFPQRQQWIVWTRKRPWMDCN